MLPCKSNQESEPQKVDFEFGSLTPGLPPPSSAKTPSRKSNQENEPQGMPKNTYFEQASPAVGLPPPPSVKTLPPQADLDVSLSSDSSEELLPQDTVETVGYASNSSMCRCFRMIYNLLVFD